MWSFTTKLVAHSEDLLYYAEQRLREEGLSGNLASSRTTRFRGNSYGCHENYLWSAPLTLRSRRTADPFLVTRRFLRLWKFFKTAVVSNIGVAARSTYSSEISNLPTSVYHQHP
jgi:hypothetical protein